MKVSHIFWGTLFIATGLLFLLNNFTTINLDWGNIWHYWPLVLILIGTSLLTKQKFGKVLFAFLAAVFLGIVIFASLNSTMSFVNNDFEIIFNDEDSSNTVIQNFSAPYDSAITKNYFHFSGGAGVFKISSTTDSMIYIRTKGINNNFKFSKSYYDSTGKFKLRSKNKGIIFGVGANRSKNMVEVSLNEKPVWNIDFDLGAALIDLDLTRFKVNKIDVNMGAASLNIKLGSLSNETNISVDAGASKIKITIPEEVAAELKIDDVLSTKEITGFQKIRSGLYRTTGFDNAKKKAYININCGVSSIKIIKYE